MPPPLPLDPPLGYTKPECGFLTYSIAIMAVFFAVFDTTHPREWQTDRHPSTARRHRPRYA